jgi:hypothetical protein
MAHPTIGCGTQAGSPDQAMIAGYQMPQILHWIALAATIVIRLIQGSQKQYVYKVG